jgi:putative membrane protein
MSDETISFLPTLNAILNATSGLLVLAGFFFIRRKQIKAHRACMVSAVAVSILFLISYLVYHYYHGATRFPGTGFVRPLYFVILISHTILAAVIVPFVFVTLRRAMRGQFLRHMKLARWTFPMWVYVSITGVVVYLMLYHFYPAH